MPRYRAPQENGGVLADPPMAEWPRLVEENRRRLNAVTVKIDGVPLNEFRRQARGEVFEAPGTGVPGVSPEKPLIVTGHQPELSHPGVWVKNFAINGLARTVGGQALNLIADTDTLKTPAMHVPAVSDNPADVRIASVPFDVGGGEQPYETRTVHDARAFATFADRVAAIFPVSTLQSLLLQRSIWANAVRYPTGDTIGEQFTRIRREWERRWGCYNLELPVSRLAESAVFLRFARHIASDADRFRAVYNHAVQTYRKAHRIRSRNHPVPDLADGELPFWGPMANGRRTRVTEIVPGIRPRALTLTLFARLCVADFFLHGIGGGKYDEVTDTIIRDYFGIEPPRYAVLSATLHLPLKPFPLTTDDLRKAERGARDRYWNPQRYLLPDSWEAMKHRDMEHMVMPTRAGRRQRYREFRRLGDELRPRLAEQIEHAKLKAEAARLHVAANAILRRRDYSWVLYPEETLRPFLTQFLT